MTNHGRSDSRLIVGKSYCTYTKQALKMGFTENQLMLDECSNGEALHRMLIEQTGQRTVPYVLEGRHLIGGYTELVKYMKQNPTG
jgi:glutaredoxin